MQIKNTKLIENCANGVANWKTCKRKKYFTASQRKNVEKLVVLVVVVCFVVYLLLLLLLMLLLQHTAVDSLSGVWLLLLLLPH